MVRIKKGKAQLNLSFDRLKDNFFIELNEPDKRKRIKKSKYKKDLDRLSLGGF